MGQVTEDSSQKLLSRIHLKNSSTNSAPIETYLLFAVYTSLDQMEIQDFARTIWYQIRVVLKRMIRFRPDL